MTFDMQMKELVTVGDVICLGDEECRVISDATVGEYVVEETKEAGGWHVHARKLDKLGRYVSDNILIQFYQCAGYCNSISEVKVVRQMTRIFV